jgi:hypothetical protein
MSTYRVVGGLWVRLGKIQCAAKALACVSACSSFNFTKRWHFVCHFYCLFFVVVSSFRMTTNGDNMASKGLRAFSYQITQMFKQAITLE